MARTASAPQPELKPVEPPVLEQGGEKLISLYIPRRPMMECQSETKQNGEKVYFFNVHLNGKKHRVDLERQIELPENVAFVAQEYAGSLNKGKR